MITYVYNFQWPLPRRSKSAEAAGAPCLAPGVCGQPTALPGATPTTGLTRVAQSVPPEV